MTGAFLRSALLLFHVEQWVTWGRFCCHLLNFKIKMAIHQLVVDIYSTQHSQQKYDKRNQ